MKISYTVECSEGETLAMLRESMSLMKELINISKLATTRMVKEQHVAESPKVGQDSQQNDLYPENPAIFRNDSGVYSYVELMFTIDKLGLSGYKHLASFPKEEGVTYTLEQVNRILDELQAHKYRSMMESVDSLAEHRVTAGNQPVEMSSFGTPAPQNDAVVGKLPVKDIVSTLPKIDPIVRAQARSYFSDFCMRWAFNFDLSGPQPDRQSLMEELGSSRFMMPILIMAYEKLSLQALIVEALRIAQWDKHQYEVVWENGVVSDEDGIWHFADKLAKHMVQVSHSGCPDLAGTYDYTGRWLRMKEENNA